MIEQISDFFSIEMIYLWLNIGVLPFWILLIFFSHTKISSFLVTSIFPHLILVGLYIYLVYYFYISGYDFLNNFKLYLGIKHLNNLFSDYPFLIMFWVHFIAINLFCGCWIVRDSQKLMISKFFIFLPLIVTYFVGPLGILIYWIIRIFFAKRMSLYD